MLLVALCCLWLAVVFSALLMRLCGIVCLTFAVSCCGSLNVVCSLRVLVCCLVLLLVVRGRW